MVLKEGAKVETGKQLRVVLGGNEVAVGGEDEVYNEFLPFKDSKMGRK